MKIIEVIRHAPTADNVAHIFMGQTDVPCDADSLCDIAPWSRDCGVAGPLIVSPLIRCVATARALFPGVPCRQDARLMERDLGRWSGRRKAEILIEHPKAFLVGGGLDPVFTPPEGEPAVKFAHRVLDFFHQLQSEPHDQFTVITHNGVIHMMRLLLGQGSMDDLFSRPEPHLVSARLWLDPAVLARHGDGINLALLFQQ